MARKVILYTAQSIDGYIAKENGAIDWLEKEEFGLDSEDFGYKNFYDSVDTTIMGKNTYDQIRSFDGPFPYADKKNFVLTHHTDLDDNVSPTQEDLNVLIPSLLAQEGKNIWLVGGGIINAEFAKLGLIDELILTIIPTALGKGVSLFEELELDTFFDLSSVRSYENGFVQLRYIKR